MMAKADQQVTSDVIANQLRNDPLPKVLERYLGEGAENPLSSQIRQLESQINSLRESMGTSASLTAAIESLRSAQKDAERAISESVAKAILVIANKYRIPLQMRQPVETQPAAPVTRPARGGASNQEFILEFLGQQTGPVRPSDLYNAAEEQGLSRPSVSQSLRRLKEIGQVEATEPEEGKRNVPIRLAK